MTNIFHITHHTNIKSIYVFFRGCNFQCRGCIRLNKRWDSHLPADVQHRLQAINNGTQLSLSEFKAIVKKVNVNRAVLGGEEPTLDKELVYIINLLNDLKLETLLLSNGYVLNKEFVEKLKEAGLSSIRVSIKAYNDNLHQYYTGQSNGPILENFKLLSKTPIKLMSESVLVPGLIEKDEIERIARFIASINPSIPYRIEGFIPVLGMSWRSASPEEVIEAVQIAKGYLENVSHIHGKKLSGEVISIFPFIESEK